MGEGPKRERPKNEALPPPKGERKFRGGVPPASGGAGPIAAGKKKKKKTKKKQRVKETPKAGQKQTPDGRKPNSASRQTVFRLGAVQRAQ